MSFQPSELNRRRLRIAVAGSRAVDAVCRDWSVGSSGRCVELKPVDSFEPGRAPVAARQSAGGNCDAHERGRNGHSGQDETRVPVG